jgi:hypothetical protein
MISLEGLSPRQHIIAECLWHRCTTPGDVKTVLDFFGHDARVVYEMMIAHAMDQYMATDEASDYLMKFRLEPD